jgi:predicted N-acetyltransferase YhbS
MAELELTLSPERPQDAAAILLMEERAFGPGRFARSAYRLREGAGHALALSFVARVGTLVVGSVRLTPVEIGTVPTLAPALLLGPLTVEPAFRSRGIGRQLMEQAMAAAAAAGHGLVLLVGDEAYYSRVGFARVPPGRLAMPGPVNPARLLWRTLDGQAPAESVRGPVNPAMAEITPRVA